MLKCDCPTELDETRLEDYLPQCMPRDALLITLGMETGLRVSELLSLAIHDVSCEGVPVTALRVPKRNLKGGRSRFSRVQSRSLPINLRAREALLTALAARPNAAPSDPLFLSRKGGQRLHFRHPHLPGLSGQFWRQLCGTLCDPVGR